MGCGASTVAADHSQPQRPLLAAAGPAAATAPASPLIAGDTSSSDGGGGSGSGPRRGTAVMRVASPAAPSPAPIGHDAAQLRLQRPQLLVPAQAPAAALAPAISPVSPAASSPAPTAPPTVTSKSTTTALVPDSKQRTDSRSVDTGNGDARAGSSSGSRPALPPLTAHPVLAAAPRAAAASAVAAHAVPPPLLQRANSTGSLGLNGGTHMAAGAVGGSGRGQQQQQPSPLPNAASLPFLPPLTNRSPRNTALAGGAPTRPGDRAATAAAAADAIAAAASPVSAAAVVATTSSPDADGRQAAAAAAAAAEKTAAATAAAATTTPSAAGGSAAEGSGSGGGGGGSSAAIVVVAPHRNNDAHRKASSSSSGASGPATPSLPRRSRSFGNVFAEQQYAQLQQPPLQTSDLVGPTGGRGSAVPRPSASSATGLSVAGGTQPTQQQQQPQPQPQPQYPQAAAVGGVLQQDDDQVVRIVEALSSYVPLAVVREFEYATITAASSSSSASSSSAAAAAASSLPPQSPEPLAREFSAALLFLDVSGFTALTEQLCRLGKIGAELISKHLNAYFGQLIELISQHGGDIIKFAGDALFVLFEAAAATDSNTNSSSSSVDHDHAASSSSSSSSPQPHQQQQQQQLEGKEAQEVQQQQLLLAECVSRAARCALEIHTALTEYRPVENVVLRLHSGVTCGRLVGMHVGAAGRWEYMFAGAPLSQIRELEEHSKVGYILITADAYRLVAADFEAEQLAADGTRLLQALRPGRTGLEPRPVVRPPLAPDTARRLLPSLSCYVPSAMVLSRLQAQTQWLGELRRVTVLFIKLPDFDFSTSSSARRQTLSSLHEAAGFVVGTLQRHEATLRQYIVDDKGTVLIAVFGLPGQSHEDDPVRGVKAALDIATELEERHWPHSIGVTTGTAFCGSVGSPARCEFSVVGDIVNLSARLMGCGLKLPLPDGRRGAVICDSATVAHSSKKLIFDPLPPQKLKGKEKLVPLFRPRTGVHLHDPLPVPGMFEQQQQQQALHFGAAAAGGGQSPYYTNGAGAAGATAAGGGSAPPLAVVVGRQRQVGQLERAVTALLERGGGGGGGGGGALSASLPFGSSSRGGGGGGSVRWLDNGTSGPQGSAAAAAAAATASASGGVQQRTPASAAAAGAAGTESQQQQQRAAAAAAAPGSSSSSSMVVLIDGEVGMGKTCLANECYRIAREFNVFCLRVAAEASERTTSFYVFRGVFEQLYQRLLSIAQGKHLLNMMRTHALTAEASFRASLGTHHRSLSRSLAAAVSGRPPGGVGNRTATSAAAATSAATTTATTTTDQQQQQQQQQEGRRPQLMDEEQRGRRQERNEQHEQPEAEEEDEEEEEDDEAAATAALQAEADEQFRRITAGTLVRLARLHLQRNLDKAVKQREVHTVLSKQRFARVVRDLAPGLLRRLSLLQAVLDVDYPLPPPSDPLFGGHTTGAPVSPEERAAATVELMVSLLSLLESLCGHLVFLFDDAHWLDPLSFRCVASMRLRLPSSLLVLSSRPVASSRDWAATLSFSSLSSSSLPPPLSLSSTASSALLLPGTTGSGVPAAHTRPSASSSAAEGRTLLTEGGGSSGDDQHLLQQQQHLLLQQAGIEHVTLGPLNAEESARLIAQRLGIEAGMASALPAELVELVNKKAQGNPLFVEELTLSLRESGCVQIEPPGRVRVDVNAMASIPFPNSIEGVITNRIDRLPDDEQMLIKVASVIGKTFSTKLTQKVSPVTLRFDSFKALQKKDFIRTVPPYGERLYTFSSLLCQEVAYDMLLFSIKSRVHFLIGTHYETKYANNLSPHYGTLSYHFLRAFECSEPASRDEKLVERALFYVTREVEKTLARLDGASKQEMQRKADDLLQLLQASVVSVSPSAAVGPSRPELLVAPERSGSSSSSAAAFPFSSRLFELSRPQGFVEETQDEQPTAQ